MDETGDLDLLPSKKLGGIVNFGMGSNYPGLKEHFQFDLIFGGLLYIAFFEILYW